ncbi:MAG: AmpG family muropeptide MFS transporter [Proteobacteria bacterium]|nr:AmpG family muropeptide MFS transporter [Pseudomonadota bacterium]
MLKKIFSLRMLITLLMGYAAGVPLLLIGSTLQAWMTEEGVSLSTIGMFSLVSMPYSLKFLWSPLMDRFQLWPGRRRGWMLLTQVFLVGALFTLSTFEPALQLSMIAATAFVVAFFSASQDIAIDSYRREILGDDELALGSSLYVVGYRLGTLVAGAMALWLADIYKMPDGTANWALVYRLMAGAMAAGILITLIAPKEDGQMPKPRSLKEAVVGPFMEFFKRDGALLILSFIVLYKVGDTMAANMTTPFMLLKGYTKTEIAAVVKGIGLFCLIFGGIIGGILAFRLGTLRSLWLFGFLQAISTAGFSVLAMNEVSIFLLTIVIAFENLTAGMGTSAYSAFMASMTNKKFTATQYALLTAVMSLPRTLLAAPSGYFSEWLGWTNFFIFCTLIAAPGMMMIPILTRKTANADRSQAPT